MGKKYIVEIGRLERLYKASTSAKGMPNMTWLSPEVDLTPYTEPDLERVRKEAYEKGMGDAEMLAYKLYSPKIDEAYQHGLNDSWEAARKVVALSTVDRRKVFGSEYMYSILEKHTASEAIEKIRQYEQIQEEDGLRHNIQTIVDQCGYSLDEIAEVLRKMRENNG